MLLGFLTEDDCFKHVQEIHSNVDLTSENVGKFENYEEKPRKKSNFKKTTIPKEKISNTSAIESNQFGRKTLDPKIEEKFKEASEDSSILQDETKTEVQITINGEDVFLIKIQKHSTNVTLADVKNQILHKPKINSQWKSWFGRNR